MKQDHLALVAGGAGGIFTSVYDKAWWLIEGDTPVWSLGQLLGLCVFFVLGGGLAWLFEEDNRRKAFFLGLGLPAFLTVAQTQDAPTAAQTQAAPATEQTQAAPAAEQSAIPLPGFALFATAHAQERVEEPPAETGAAAAADEQPAPMGGRRMIIQSAADHPCPKGTLRFYVEMQETRTIPLASCGEAIEVPSAATHFGISTRDANPNRFPLREEKVATYEMRYEYNFWTDFRAGLGARDLRAYDLLLSRVTVLEEPNEEKPPETDPVRPGF